MGAGSDKLVFHTLKAMYNLDDDQIISNPRLFEEKLGKVLGKSAKTVINSIANELRKEIFEGSICSSN